MLLNQSDPVRVDVDARRDSVDEVCVALRQAASFIDLRPTKREAHNERRVNWCSKRGAHAAL